MQLGVPTEADAIWSPSRLALEPSEANSSTVVWNASMIA